MSFALRFGFVAIFAAIGFSVAVGPDAVVVEVDPACLDVDGEPDVVTVPADAAGLPVVGFACLPLVVVVLPVPCVLVPTGLPLSVGLPVLCVVIATDLPLVVALTDAGGWADLAPCLWAKAVESVKDVAARSRIVMRLAYEITSVAEIRKRMPRRL